MDAGWMDWMVLLNDISLKNVVLFLYSTLYLKFSSIEIHKQRKDLFAFLEKQSKQYKRNISENFKTIASEKYILILPTDLCKLLYISLCH